MVTSQIYIIIAIVALAFIALFFVRKNKKKEKLTALTILAFGFIFAGILFSDGSRLIPYSLMGIGVVLAVIDIIIKLRKK
tara:strand:+ start:7197 stop:7436 length:240 start_codon:yes stop_codon:yes gene_type:complete